ncbi:MAG: NAD(P)/FAD-dependent oxidoreductase [Chloroflexota bacterium]
MADARALYPDFEVTRSWQLPAVPVASDDESLESYLMRIGFSDDQLYYTRRSWGNAAGDDISRLSAEVSLVEINDESAGHGDYRILDGYDSLPNALSVGIDVRLNTVVSSIDWEDDPVVVTTCTGETHRAERVLITLPLGVLQAGNVHFSPELPAEKQAAIDMLVMGPALKLIYRFAKPVLPPGMMALYSATNPPMWWQPSTGHDTDVTIMTAFVTGDWARELHAEGEEGALEHGFQTLQRELGRELPRPLDAVMVNWIDDPFALGGYSVAPPGAANAREMLAQPTGERLFWAGEATAPNAWSSTVHGAYASGRRAAAEILVMLERQELSK